MGACRFPPPRRSFTTLGDVAIHASGMTGMGPSANKPGATPGDEPGLQVRVVYSGLFRKTEGREGGRGGREGVEQSVVSGQPSPGLRRGKGWGRVLWRSCPTGAEESGFLPQNWSLAKGEGPWGWVTSFSRLLADMVATGEAFPQGSGSGTWQSVCGGAPREPRCPDFTARFLRQHQPPTPPLLCCLYQIPPLPVAITVN